MLEQFISHMHFSYNIVLHTATAKALCSDYVGDHSVHSQIQGQSIYQTWRKEQREETRL